MREADTWKERLAKIEADLESIKLVTMARPETGAIDQEPPREANETGGRKEGFLLRRLARRLCRRGPVEAC